MSLEPLLGRVSSPRPKPPAPNQSQAPETREDLAKLHPATSHQPGVRSHSHALLPGPSLFPSPSPLITRHVPLPLLPRPSALARRSASDYL
jgi:hypothetical protein